MNKIKIIAERAYMQLTDKQKDVWNLYMRLCCSEYETAEQLGITRNAVHDRLNKARRSFKRYMKELKRGK